MYDELELDKLGDRKTALFLIMSDTDSTFNFLISMIYTQLFNLLCDKADDVYGGKLPIHVRCLIDECANIGQIPQLEKGIPENQLSPQLAGSNKWILGVYRVIFSRQRRDTTMEFFNSAVDVLKTLVVALGAGLGVWGAVNLMEGYGGDNPSANAHVR